MSAIPSVRVQPKLDQDKENVPNDDTSREASVGKKARRESPKPGKNSWRRSAMPLPGQKRVGRLKRVDFDVGQLYNSQEEKMVRTPLATKQDNNQV